MDRAIGVIDSGVGGLTVAHEIMRQLPNEQIIYLGDTLRCPYGSRTKDEVKQFTIEMVDFLMQKELKMIVVACNTATAFTLDLLKQKLSIPVIGVIRPGARAAIKATRNKKIGIIGTEGTIRSNAYPATLKEINPGLDVQALACPLFVPMVEKGILEGEQATAIVRDSLLPFQRTHQFDTLVLGCTHYPLLEKTIQQVMGQEVNIISSSDETAREVSTLLEYHKVLRTEATSVDHLFYTTGDLDIFRTISQVIFKEEVTNLRKVSIEKVVI